MSAFRQALSVEREAWLSGPGLSEGEIREDFRDLDYSRDLRL